jgi:hypothetical protein
MIVPLAHAELFLRNTPDITAMIQIKPNNQVAIAPIHHHIYLYLSSFSPYTGFLEYTEEQVLKIELPVLLTNVP